MKLAYILFLQICLLTIPNSYSKAIVNKANSNASTVSFFETSTPYKAIFEKTLSDSDQLKFVLLENTSETEKCSTPLLASSLHLNGNSLRDNHFAFDENAKLNRQGLMERNFTPFRNMSRNILFHSLKIHF
ncbi:MAG: hypothetical protein J7574_11990 [Flavobacterium sp.]|uniref:hypothetical protein n=1 Tax=Flavobacterium sp. TaxID=239 RepID=UPI001B1962A5|nr:hypothetical protein [Flavobacterium sp.]MBO9584870.1 hypothetical protein [Flavobacterium sp.]